MKKAVVAGSIVLDIIPLLRNSDEKDLQSGTFCFEQGKQSDLNGIKMYLGGCVGNTGVAFHKLGVPVTLVGKVGDDQPGEIIRNTLRNQEIHSEITVVSGMPSTSSVIIAAPGCDRMILHSRGAAQSFSPEDISTEVLQNVSLFHFGYPPTMAKLWLQGGAGLAVLLKSVKDVGVVTSLDMCMPKGLGNTSEECRTALQRALPYVDVFLPSIEEMLFMLDRSEYEAMNARANGRNCMDYLSLSTVPRIAEELLAMGVAVVCLKVGKKGLYMRTAGRPRLEALNELLSEHRLEEWADRELWIPPCTIDHMLSTTGAGDTAIAGFLASLLSGHSPETTLKIASCTAAQCIKTFDTVSGIPSLDVMEVFAGQDFPQEDFIMSLPGWQRRGKFYYGPGETVGEPAQNAAGAESGR